jgi:hypothetical protein
MMRGRLKTDAFCLVAGMVAVYVRAQGLHRGLIYPDGYQYLLMARGISAHLTPILRLGSGGDVFVPSVDAALKPLFPALVAIASGVAGLRLSAEAVTVVAGAATVALAAMLAARLTGSAAAAAVAALAVLLSPALAYWTGYVGPDALAPAFVLATGLAAIERRPVAAGLLGACAATTRPEWALVLAALGLATLARPAARAFAGAALLAGCFAVAAIIAIVRPPLAVPPGGAILLVVALAGTVATTLVGDWCAGTPRRAAAATVMILAAFVGVGLTGRVAALGTHTRSEWPLLLLAVFGLVRACLTGRARPALMIVVVMATLGTVYVYRNAGSERYLAQLLPLAGVAAGLAVEPWPRQPRTAWRLRLPAPAWVRHGLRAGAALAVVALAGIVAPRPAEPAPDAFSAIAGQLTHAPAGALISAAPDAYGFLVRDRPERMLRPGARGLILLDPAQRAYAPGLTARGVRLARLSVPNGFERPDGTLDTGPAWLIRGVVAAAR